jgi:hypothetical protein
MRVTVDHSAESQVFWPDSLDLAPFEVLSARVQPGSTGEGGARTTLTLELAAFELGDLEIPGFNVGITDENGNVMELVTSPYGIRVTSVGLDEGGDIRDVKGPLGIPLGAGRILLGLLATVLVPLLAYLVYRRMARRDLEAGEMGSIVPGRPPHEVALEALDRLAASPLLERGGIKEFHIQVSEILRIYVEDRFHVPALEMTTVDIVRGLERVGVDPSVQEGFEEFLHPCDLVKFAKARPDAEASMGVLTLGRRLVEDTIPTPEPTVEEEPEVGDPPTSTPDAQAQPVSTFGPGGGVEPS